jgi:Ca2+-binding RTX toxin-like protein
MTPEDYDEFCFRHYGDDVLSGSPQTDLVNLFSGNDTVLGGTGNDVLRGDAGNDELLEESGNDKLNGGAGNDTIDGGSGKDTLTGGTGFDRFDFNSVAESAPGTVSRDLITDFSHGVDQIDLSSIDADFQSEMQIDISGNQGSFFSSDFIL